MEEWEIFENSVISMSIALLGQGRKDPKLNCSVASTYIYVHWQYCIALKFREHFTFTQIRESTKFAKI